MYEKGVYVRKIFNEKPVVVSFGSVRNSQESGSYFKKGFHHPTRPSLLRLERVLRKYSEQGQGKVFLSVNPIGWSFYLEEP